MFWERLKNEKVFEKKRKYPELKWGDDITTDLTRINDKNVYQNL